jgi:outer membrane protein assembly factor BamB
VVSSGRVLIGSYDQSLYALEARTGKLAWKHETDGPVHATASVADGITYVAGCDEILRAIRVADGSELFQVSSGGYTGASAALAGGRAFYGNFENQVMAVDLHARKQAWRYEHPERKFPFYSSAALPEGRVLLGGRDKLVHCLDAATGDSKWTFSTRARVDSSPAVAASRVYVGSSDGRLYVLELATGALVQEHDLGAPLTASPALASSRLVIGSEDGLVACLG